MSSSFSRIRFLASWRWCYKCDQDAAVYMSRAANYPPSIAFCPEYDCTDPHGALPAPYQPEYLWDSQSIFTRISINSHTDHRGPPRGCFDPPYQQAEAPSCAVIVRRTPRVLKNRTFYMQYLVLRELATHPFWFEPGAFAPTTQVLIATAHE